MSVPGLEDFGTASHARRDASAGLGCGHDERDVRLRAGRGCCEQRKSWIDAPEPLTIANRADDRRGAR